MDKEELLSLYLEKLRILTLEKLNEENITVMEVLKKSLLYLEGELQGY